MPKEEEEEAFGSQIISNSLCLNIDGQEVKQNEYVKLLGVQIDKKVNFDVCVKEVC